MCRNRWSLLRIRGKFVNCQMTLGGHPSQLFSDEWDLGLYWTVEMVLVLVLVLILVLLLMLVSIFVFVLVLGLVLVMVVVLVLVLGLDWYC